MEIDENSSGALRRLKRVPNRGAYEVKSCLDRKHISPYGRILYVNKAARDGNGSGKNWENAIVELADALRWAYENKDKGLWSEAEPLQIWVAEGTYRPMYSPEDGKHFSTPIKEPRDRSFLLVKNVQLYGGFPMSGNPGMSDRLLKLRGGSATILSGDYKGDDSIVGKGKGLKMTDRTDKAFHVVLLAGDMGEKCRLDGFSIVGGGSDNQGSSIRVAGHRFCRAYGGGIYNMVTAGSPTFKNLEICDNMASSTSAYAYGGGVYTEYSGEGVMTWHNNNIHNNTVLSSSVASAAFGGAVYNWNYGKGTMIWTNNYFSDNAATSTSLTYGGAIYNANEGVMTWTNTVVKDNHATSSSLAYGGGIFNSNSGAIAWINNQIVGNRVCSSHSSAYGGGVYNKNTESGTMTWINSSIVGNTIVGNPNSVTAGMYNKSGTRIKVYNSVVYGNEGVRSLDEDASLAVPFSIDFYYTNFFIEIDSERM
ncbi:MULTISPECIES: hypothetical protein [Sphingobacterium]|uniref:hypothetical protein n=1 Tax=Sphingobacterium TaxID=28453 RepID=UPI0013DCAE98|nr:MULTISPECIES: hypothetical protein [unclassified Sphingobacterium]